MKSLMHIVFYIALEKQAIKKKKCKIQISENVNKPVLAESQ